MYVLLLLLLLTTTTTGEPDMVTVQMSAPRALVSSDVMFAVSKLSRAGKQYTSNMHHKLLWLAYKHTVSVTLVSILASASASESM
jgi:hypothetical protein